MQREALKNPPMAADEFLRRLGAAGQQKQEGRQKTVLMILATGSHWLRALSGENKSTTSFPSAKR